MHCFLVIVLFYFLWTRPRPTDVCVPSPQIFVSRKWGFTKFDRDTYEELRADHRLRNDGANVQYLREHGPLKTWKRVRAALEQE